MINPEVLLYDLNKVREIINNCQLHIRANMVTEPAAAAAKNDTRVLDIPFVSQVGKGASKFNNDCGAAAGSMVTKAFWPGDEVTPDSFYKLTGKKKDVYLSVGDIRRVLYDRFGIATNWILKPDVKKWIDGGLAIIALIKYGPIQDWADNPHSNFRDMHYVVVAGYRPGSAFIRDPLYPSSSFGGYWIPNDIFYRAWSGGSPALGAIVTAAPIGTEVKFITNVEIVTHYGVNVRAGPGIGDTILGAEPFGKILQVFEWDYQKGGDIWARIGPGRWLAVLFDGTILAVKVQTD